jgi:hypothetical protein
MFRYIVIGVTPQEAAISAMGKVLALYPGFRSCVARRLANLRFDVRECAGSWTDGRTTPHGPQSIHALLV